MRSSVRRAWTALAFLTVIGTSAIVTAQATDEISEHARALFQEGLAFADHGEWERAVEHFRQALDVRESPPIRYNLALSLVHMGRLVEALDELGRVLADPTTGDDVRENAARLQGELLPRLGRLTVEVRGASEDTTVTIDGRPLPREAIGGPAPTDPGVRVARLVRGTAELDVQEVDVPEGGSAHVLLAVAPPPLAPARDEEPAPVARGSDDAWIWGIVIGVVVLVAGGAAVLGWALTDSAAQPSMGDFAPPVLEFD